MNLAEKIENAGFTPSGFLPFGGFDEAVIGIAIGAHFEERLAYDEDKLLELIEV